MACAFRAHVQFGSARISVLLPRDFYHNSLTYDPYPHSHPKYEVHYILSGSCTLIAGEKRIRYPQGHFLILPPGSSTFFCPTRDRCRPFRFSTQLRAVGQRTLSCRSVRSLC